MPQMNESDYTNLNSLTGSMDTINNSIRAYMNRQDFNPNDNNFRTGLTNMLDQLNQQVSYYNQAADTFGFAHHPGAGQFNGATQAMSLLGYNQSDPGSNPYSTQALGGTPLADTMQAGYNIPTGSTTPITPTQVPMGYGAGPNPTPAQGQLGAMQNQLSGQGAPQGGGQSTPFPNISENLSPGSTGNSVQQLQQWLISQGYQIPAGATGYYGQQTQAAVEAWQHANNVPAGQNYGYFGPISRNYATGQGGQAGAGAPTQTGAPAQSFGTNALAGTPAGGASGAGQPMGATGSMPNSNQLIQTLMGLTAPGTQETNTMQQLNNLLQSRDLGIQDIKEQAIPMKFISGQGTAVTERAALQAQPLQAQLATLQARRQSALDAAKTAYDIQKDVTKPQEVSAGSSLVRFNPQTGRYEVSYQAPFSPSQQTANQPTSYREWQLAGSPGTYANWINTHGGQTPFGFPTPQDRADLSSLLGKHPMEGGGIDQERLQSDPQYFYYVKSQLEGLP